MSDTSKNNDTHIEIPSNIDAGSTAEAYAALLAGLDAAKDSGAVTSVELVGNDDPSALCIQLLVSARLSFPSETFKPGPKAGDALSSLQTSKVI